MRYSRLAGLALAAALVLPGLAPAQPRVEITGVRIGFPGSIIRANNRMTAQTRFRTGQWAPVYVDLEVKDARLEANTYVLVVETTDSDDMQNVYVEKRFLPTVEPKEQPTLLTYVRPGSSSSDITVSVRHALTDQELRHKKVTSSDVTHMPANVYGYLTAGGRVRSLYRALVAKGPNQGIIGVNPPFPQQPGADGGDEDADPEENGNRSFAHIDMVAQMPTYWFGYQPVDTVILLTSTKQFVDDLSTGKQDDPFYVRREALAEWVRRGGRLMISVSQNHQEVNQILEQMNIIDLKVEGRAQVKQLGGVEAWANARAPFVGVAPKNQPGAQAVVEIAKLKPGRGVQVLAYDKTNPGADAHPVIVQAPCGLGRVIVVGFDLDQLPFAAWGGVKGDDGRVAFWRQMKANIEPATVGENVAQVNQWRGFNQDGSGELAGKLVRSLEAFPDVPVISFGWVALFILVYIIIVGPLDYFFLKKVVKRLELTWITFPAVVIVISAVAYFAAYYLKGNDLRINKVDVVDMDLHGGNVYGSTWFTLFSPRIQNYTIGVEPGTGWGAEEKDPKKYAPFVSWMGRPEEGYGGGRGGSQGLFRRAYNYAPESSGLVGVPIQVWSTKTFSASWYRPVKDDELIDADLTTAVNNPNKVSGKITSHLPVELRDVVAFYRGQYYTLDKLSPNETLRIDEKMDLGKGGQPQTWFGQALQPQQNFQAPGRRGGYYAGDMPQAYGSYMKSVLFHAHPGDNTQQNVRNSMLRHLDEQWRLSPNNRGEVILFGRAAPPAGKANEGGAEEMSQGGLSASKLWLNALPGGGNKRPDIRGTLAQETYVRAYIPVKTSK